MRATCDWNRAVRIWEDELLREYRLNKFESLKKAEALTFRFDEKLIFSQYLSRKTNLLHDVGIANEDIMINYFSDGLDIKLTLTTSLREDEDTFENFGRRVRQNESAAKRVHDLKKKRLTKKFVKKSYVKKAYALKLRHQKRQNDLSSKKIQKLLTRLSSRKIKEKP